jgi:hypothetical protein
MRKAKTKAWRNRMEAKAWSNITAQAMALSAAALGHLEMGVSEMWMAMQRQLAVDRVRTNEYAWAMYRQRATDLCIDSDERQRMEAEFAFEHALALVKLIYFELSIAWKDRWLSQFRTADGEPAPDAIESWSSEWVSALFRSQLTLDQVRLALRSVVWDGPSISADEFIKTAYWRSDRREAMAAKSPLREGASA